MGEAPYDAIADWYHREFRPRVTADEQRALDRLLGPGSGPCLDLGCGTGVASELARALGWSVVGVDVSDQLAAVALEKGFEVVSAPAESLPFDDESFDAVISVWTHTDIADFSAAAREVARVLRPEAPFVYIGGHPCFVGPHSLFLGAEGVPQFHAGYRPSRAYDASAPGVGDPQGLRARVGSLHLTLEDFLGGFVAADLRIDAFEELTDRDYPYLVALRARR